MKIPLVDLKAQYKVLKSEINNSIKDTIANATFIQGEEVALFEKEFSQYLGSKYCIGLNSGTDALTLGLRALNLDPGDEVILPANTFFATISAVVQNGLKPVLCDIDDVDHGLSLEDLNKKISKKTRVVIIVHLYGRSDKIFEIKNIIRQKSNRIYIIEDSCQAHGARYKKQKVGTFGIFSAFSFHPGKNLGAYGDGGALITSNKNIKNKVKLFREYGQTKKYIHKQVAGNSRLDSIQAAILRVKLRYLDRENKLRQQLAFKYNKKLSQLYPNCIIPAELPDRQSIYHLYVIQCKRRNKLLHYLHKNNIGAQIHYPIPLHLQPAIKYLGYKNGDLPHAETMAKKILSLPIFPYMSVRQLNYIVEKIKLFYEKN